MMTPATRGWGRRIARTHPGTNATSSPTTKRTVTSQGRSDSSPRSGHTSRRALHGRPEGTPAHGFGHLSRLWASPAYSSHPATARSTAPTDADRRPHQSSTREERPRFADPEARAPRRASAGPTTRPADGTSPPLPSAGASAEGGPARSAPPCKGSTPGASAPDGPVPLSGLAPAGIAAASSTTFPRDSGAPVDLGESLMRSFSHVRIPLLTSSRPPVRAPTPARRITSPACTPTSERDACRLRAATA